MLWQGHTPVGDVFRVETMTANAPVFRAYQGADQLRHPGGIVQGEKSIQATFVGPLRNLGAAVEIRHALPHGVPRQHLRRASLHGQSCEYRNRRVRALRPFADD